MDSFLLILIMLNLVHKAQDSKFFESTLEAGAVFSKQSRFSAVDFEFHHESAGNNSLDLH
jgi:hypothetical protein